MRCFFHAASLKAKRDIALEWITLSPRKYIIISREEEVLVSEYTLTLLGAMLHSYTSKYSSTVELAIKHLTRIVATKYEVFLKPSKTRIPAR